VCCGYPARSLPHHASSTLLIFSAARARQDSARARLGAIHLYLLIAMTFATLLALAGLTITDSFEGIAFQDDSALASSLFYLSFVTLTSTGYGDIVPVHPLARSLCSIENIIGQLYPATILARLVTLELESTSQAGR
jgi:Ion channel